MNTQLLQQFRREAEAWKRLLEFLQTENAYLKTRIAEIAQDIPNELLPEIEKFQNRSIAKDQMIDVARQYLINFQAFVRDEFSQKNPSEKILPTQKNLRNHIETIEKNFNALKAEFNQYLSQKL